MDWLSIGSTIIRSINFILWIYVVARIAQHDTPVPRLVRQLICSVILFGMGAFVLGSFTPFGLDGSIARMVYTIFTAYAAIIALAIATTDILDPVSSPPMTSEAERRQEGS